MLRMVRGPLGALLFVCCGLALSGCGGALEPAELIRSGKETETPPASTERLPSSPAAEGDAGASPSSTPDAGPAAPGPSDAGTPALTCTSNRLWTRGNAKDPAMRPGTACIACHVQDDAPNFGFAGTLFPSIQEKDDCYGSTVGEIVLTDRDGRVYRAKPNASGNFFENSGGVRFPAKVRVLLNGKERAMVTPAPHGDCNLCHTATGAQGAQGRVALP